MISIVILVKNESRHLEELLPTLDWADRLFVIDDNSTDETVRVARLHGAEVHTRNMRGNFAQQRNWALKKVRTKWVLFLDADERISDELRDEILEVTTTTNEYDGYLIKRNDVFNGKKLHHGETAHTYLVRLGLKKAGVWKRKVHEYWDITNVGTLRNGLEHNSHESYSQLFGIVQQYAKLEAESRVVDGVQGSGFELVIYPIAKFIKNYFWYLGILDGLPGLGMALAMSYHSFLVRKYIFSLTYPKQSLSFSIRLFRILVWSVLVTFALGQLMRFEFFSGAIYGFEICMLFAILSGVLLLISEKKYTLPYFFGGVAIFLIVLLISLVIQIPLVDGTEIVGAILYWLRLCLYAGFFAIFWNGIRSGWWRVSIPQLLTYIGFFWVITGILQYLLIPDVRFLFWYGWDDHFYRLVGLLFDPGYLGLLFVLFLILLEKRLSGLRMWTIYLMGFLALMLTYSRSAYVVYAVSLISLGIYLRQWKSIGMRFLLLLMSVLVLVLYVPVGGESVNLKRTYSVVSRAESAVTAYDIFSENKLMGIGFNRYPNYFSSEELSVMRYHPSAPDNSYLFILATSGIIGLSSLILVVLQLGYYFRYNGIIITSMLVVLVHALTNNSLFYVFVMLWMILLMSSGQKKIWFKKEPSVTPQSR